MSPGWVSASRLNTPSTCFQSRCPAITADPGSPGVGPYFHHTRSLASPGISRPPVASTPPGRTGPSAPIDGTSTRTGASASAAGVSTPTPTRASWVTIGAIVVVVVGRGGRCRRHRCRSRRGDAGATGFDVDGGGGGAAVDVEIRVGAVVVTAGVDSWAESPPAARATMPAMLGAMRTSPTATASRRRCTGQPVVRRMRTTNIAPIGGDERGGDGADGQRVGTGVVRERAAVAGLDHGRRASAGP